MMRARTASARCGRETVLRAAHARAQIIDAAAVLRAQQRARRESALRPRRGVVGQALSQGRCLVEVGDQGNELKGKDNDVLMAAARAAGPTRNSDGPWRAALFGQRSQLAMELVEPARIREEIRGEQIRLADKRAVINLEHEEGAPAGL